MSKQYSLHMKKRDTVNQCLELLVSRAKWSDAQAEMLGSYFSEAWRYAKARAKKKAIWLANSQ